MKKRKNNNKRTKKQTLRRIKRRFLIILSFSLVICIVYVICNDFLSVYINASKDILSTASDKETQADATLLGNTADVTEPTTQPHTLPENLVDALPVQSVPMIYQYPQLPTGCEATAAAMLLQAYGYDADKEAVADALPKADFEQYNGEEYAPHPDCAFIGDPYSDEGYGALSGATAEAMQSIIDSRSGSHYAVCLDNADETQILSLIDKGIPICIWATIRMLELVDTGGWYIKDGETYTDEYYQWPGNEHCMVLVSYDEYYVTVHDPLTGVQEYDRELFFYRYEQLGRHAIALKEEP
ncbi:MAG: C39 family peptidase [Acutalibacteraceae bacterium]